MDSYLVALEAQHRCISEVQRETRESLLDALNQAWQPGEQQLEHTLDDAMVVSLQVLQAQAAGQRDMQKLAAQWFNAMHALCLIPLQGEDCPWSRALHLSEVSCSALFKASRQVNHFAITRLSVSALSAARETRRAWLHPLAKPPWPTAKTQAGS